jgi:hypothetical protein
VAVIHEEWVTVPKLIAMILGGETNWRQRKVGRLNNRNKNCTTVCPDIFTKAYICTHHPKWKDKVTATSSISLTLRPSTTLRSSRRNES